jgi:hypothetical protein
VAERKRENINLVIALPAEAKPLIRLLKLQRDQVNMALPVYRQDHFQLVISGPGREAATQGVRYLHSIQPNAEVKWFNIGICGHGSLELGTLILIDCIVDQQTGRRWSLTTTPESIHPSGILTCVDIPQTDYAPEMAYDMESSGFIDAVSSLNQVEFARIIKIVSDNPQHNSRKINGKLIRTLFEQQLESVNAMIQY